MPFESWQSYTLTVLLLMSTPGPSHLLMLSTSINCGFRRSLATAAGDLSANALQMLVAGVGLATVLLGSATAFTVVKWCGVAYLLWLGVNMLRAGAATANRSNRPRPARRLWLRGFATSAANPKAVVFFAALFPQFIDPALPLWPQLIMLSITYLIIDGLFLCGYGAGAAWIAARLNRQAQHWLDRAGGTFLIGAALLLSTRSLQRAT